MSFKSIFHLKRNA